MKKVMLLVAVIVLGTFSTNVHAVMTVQADPTYSFKHIVEDGDGASQLANGIIGQAQMFVNVSNVNGGNVLFTFTNTGPFASSITDIYFDDDNLISSISFIDNSDSGVLFSEYANPINLPGGNNLSPAFVTTAGLSIDSDPPTQPNGVNPGESLGITVGLINGMTFNNVISDLASGALRIGIHVQGFAEGSSETFVNNNVIPAPGAIVLAGIGASAVGWLRRRVMI